MCETRRPRDRSRSTRRSQRSRGRPLRAVASRLRAATIRRAQRFTIACGSPRRARAINCSRGSGSRSRSCRARSSTAAGVRGLGQRGSWSLVQFSAAPPAAVVYEWLWIPDAAAAVARMFPPGARKGLDHGVVVLRGSGPQNQDEPSAPEPCTLDRWDSGAIDLTCTAHADAYAVISSSAAAGLVGHCRRSCGDCP